MHREIELQVKTVHQDQDDIIRRCKQLQQKIEEACPESETVYSTQMAIIQGFHFRSKALSPSSQNRDTQRNSARFVPEGRTGCDQPPLHLLHSLGHQPQIIMNLEETATDTSFGDPDKA
jgi:hypothetical protein